ncbi:hypothetical protein BDV10DRAFT_135439 [Aspergillus recurvatus]
MTRRQPYLSLEALLALAPWSLGSSSFRGFPSLRQHKTTPWPTSLFASSGSVVGQPFFANVVVTRLLKTRIVSEDRHACRPSESPLFFPARLSAFWCRLEQTLSYEYVRGDDPNYPGRSRGA